MKTIAVQTGEKDVLRLGSAEQGSFLQVAGLVKEISLDELLFEIASSTRRGETDGNYAVIDVGEITLSVTLDVSTTLRCIPHLYIMPILCTWYTDQFERRRTLYYGLLLMKSNRRKNSMQSKFDRIGLCWTGEPKFELMVEGVQPRSIMIV